MVTRKTASGNDIDMEALMVENEEVIAVGNTRMNARGDTLDSKGNVIQTVQETATAYYKENPNAVITQSTKEELGVTQQSTLRPDQLDPNASVAKQEFDDWVDPENSVETPTGKVTKEEDRVVASGGAKTMKKAQPKAKKSIDDIYQGA
mgnify:CR=1 FL=1|tara:strand:+ start:657 stop:1103 length:447 start_codon:yes stop_codon:yes gene_type:complete